MKSLTVFEETVMLAIYKLAGNAYSVTIHQEILEMTGKDVILGTLFRALDQMCSKGYLSKKKSQPVSAKGGKSKLFYSISDSGYEAMEQTRQMHDRIWREIPDLLVKKS